MVSLGAAGVHFSMTVQHFHQGFAWGIAFAALAWFQLTWALLMGIQPSAKAAFVGAIANAAGLAIYFVASSSSSELRGSSVGTISAIFGVALVLAGLAMAKSSFLARPVPSRTVLVSTVTTAVAIVFSTTAVLASYSAPAASAASSRKASSSSSPGSMSGMDMANPYMSANVDPSWHYTGPPIPPQEVTTLTRYAGTVDMGHVMETPTCNTPPTMKQQQLAFSLVQQTSSAVAKYEDINAAIAAGYVPMTDPNYEIVHYVKVGGPKANGVIDPNNVPFLVYATVPSGQKVLAAAMYIDQTGTAPMPGGCLTQWHEHNNLCFDPKLLHITSFAPCPPGTKLLNTGFMFHVWQVPVPGGALALDPSDLQVEQAAIMSADNLSPYASDEFNSAPPNGGGVTSGRR